MARTLCRELCRNDIIMSSCEAASSFDKKVRGDRDRCADEVSVDAPKDMEGNLRCTPRVCQSDRTSSQENAHSC